MSNYKNFLSQFKRKQPDSTSSSSDADTPDVAKHVNKRLNFEDIEPETMESQLSTLMAEINRRFDALQESLASKDDINKMKSDFKAEIDNLTTTFVKKIDSLEERVLKVESEREEVAAVKQTNADLFSKLNRQGKRIDSLRAMQNDAEQQSRKWNLRVYNVPESRTEEPETGAVCIRKCCKIFTDMVGVPVTESDIEVAHRLGNRSPRHDRSRPIIVRFCSRKKKDEVLTSRRKLKGNEKKIAIGEDLTSLNYKLLKEAKEHSATLDAWCSNGKIIAKLKNGKTVKLDITCDLDTTLRKEM